MVHDDVTVTGSKASSLVAFSPSLTAIIIFVLEKEVQKADGMMICPQFHAHAE
jgi:hypothetical protein